MCKCTPNIRTPFCGKPGCEWPPQLSPLPPEFDEAGKHQMREKARRGLPEAFGEMSDEWVADRVRMLMRKDLWHEAICTAGRDRIMRLSLEVERQSSALERAHALLYRCVTHGYSRGEINEFLARERQPVSESSGMGKGAKHG